MHDPLSPQEISKSQASMFCRNCRTSSGEGSVCVQCGDTLQPQGYCEICESWLFQNPGTECPKHDVTLLDGRSESGLDPSSTRMVTIARYSLLLEAQGPRLRLEAEGIAVFLDGERMGTNVIYQVATGGIKLQVPEEFAAEARVLIAQSWSPAKGEGDDPDDPWEGLEPQHPADQRRSLMKKAIVFHLLWPVVVYAVILVCVTIKRLIP